MWSSAINRLLNQKTKNYELICFDLDDTLWPCMPTIQYAEQTLYSWLSKNIPAITQAYSSDQLREKRKQLFQAQPELTHDLSEARRVHLRQLAAEFDVQGDWVETAFDVFYEARQKVKLFPDVLPVLSDLKQRYRLVALTNGNAHISKTGLLAYFDLQISAADVQQAKPHPAMFHKAMQHMGTPAEKTLHVGDHPVHDIQGARNAGVDAVWLNRFNQPWNTRGNMNGGGNTDGDTDGNAAEARPEQQFIDLYQLNEWLKR